MWFTIMVVLGFIIVFCILGISDANKGGGDS